MKTKIIQLVFTLLFYVSFVQAADHNLPTTNLPTGGATPVDEKMSTFVTMQLISQYYSVSTSLNSVLEASWPAVRANGHSSGWGEIYDVTTLLNYLYNIGPNGFGLSLIEYYDVQDNFLIFGSNDVVDAIDSGHPVMVILGSGSVDHAVMITGYNNNGTYEYFDPTTGYYDTVSSTDPYLYYGPFGGEIIGVK